MNELDHVQRANQYIELVLNNKVPACKWVRLACQRQKDDVARWDGRPDAPYYFDVESANHVCMFLELLPHIKGPLAGETIMLELWQSFVLTTIFGWRKKADRKRRFRRVYIEVPRGNAKSTLSSGVGLYMLCADDEGGPECYSFATTRDQAKIVFGDAQAMARRTPGLKVHFDVLVQAHQILTPYASGKFEALSAEGSTLDGLNTHFACVDELHAHKTRNVYDVVETSMGKRDQSMLWVITTAGSDRSGICYEVRGFMTKVLNQQTVDESQFGIIYGLDDTDDWTTESALIKANPNWGVSVRPEVVLALQAKAMSMASAANNFRTKHCNEWVNADVAWMDMRAWARCGDPKLRREDFYGQPAVVALDLASKVDIAAKTLMFRKDDHFFVFNQYYLPRETVDRNDNSQYSGWEQEGRLTVTEGAVTDFQYIEEDLLEDCSKYEVREVPFDPFQATQLSTRMLQKGLPMVEFRPTVMNFSEPMKQLEALVLQGTLHHDGDPILEWMVSNVVCHVDAKDNIYPRKDRNENKIDGVISLIMALGRTMAIEHQGATGMLLL